jgi:PAS domain S-box-containing protein
MVVDEEAELRSVAIQNAQTIQEAQREAKRAKEALEELRLRLAAVMDFSDDAILTKTLDGVIRSWNAGAQRIFGYTEAEVIGRHITLLLPPERVQEEDDILQRLSRGEHVDHFETVRVRKDQQRIDVSVTISPIRDRTGRILGASKIARDITVRKRADERARFLAKSSAALAEAPDLHLALRRIAELAVMEFADWCCIYLVDASGSLERIGSRHREADEELSKAELEAVRKVLITGTREFTGTRERMGDLISRRIGPNGETNWSSHLCVPLAVETERLGALTFATTQSRPTFGDDDVRAAEDLAHRVALAIENAKLLDALREADRRKDEFLAMLAHELRNPLAPIQNAVHILREKGPPVPELDWARDVIERQLSQLSRLVDDLLDVSRITQGRIELRKQRIDLTAVVHDAVEASAPQIERAGHDLTVELPPEPLQLDADPTRITQVLMNLLNNAAKFTDPGGLIRLVAERDDDQLVIRVRDNGIGIPAPMLQRIFEMFMQADRSLERSQLGMGIGLTLVRWLVALHGGTVEAQSGGPGLGSEFTVRLPLDESPQQTPQAPLANSVAEPAAVRRVLVVDDNRDAAESLAILLGLKGYELRTVHDGVSAIGEVAQFRPDVVLLDLGLPGLNGYEVARRIRDQQGDEVVLVAVTGWGAEDDRRRSAAAGFDHHLTKPVDLEMLSELIASASSSRPASALR